LLATPRRTTWTGRRDHVLLAVAVPTRLRASELIVVRRTDIHLGVVRMSAASAKTQALNYAPHRGGRSRWPGPGSTSKLVPRRTYQDGRLIYAARTRNGFTPEVRQKLFEKLRQLEVAECPFANLPEAEAGGGAKG
jgi:hypothetical protein